MSTDLKLPWTRAEAEPDTRMTVARALRAPQGQAGPWQGFAPRVHTGTAAAPWPDGINRAGSSEGSGEGGAQTSQTKPSDVSISCSTKSSRVRAIERWRPF